MEEQVIERYLTNKVKQLGGKSFKFVSPGNAGVPDRIVIIPGGHIFFIELKAPGKKPRKLQQVVIKQLKKLGCNVLTIDSKEQVKEFISGIQIKNIKENKRNI